MSHISTAFRVLMPQPLLTARFQIIMPSLVGERFSAIVEAASYPEVKYQQVEIPFGGEYIIRPTGRQESTHRWKIRVQEDFLFTVREAILAKTGWVYRENYQMTNLISQIWVFIINQEGVPLPAFKLRHCWISARDTVALDGSNPQGLFKWNVEICYADMIENSLLVKANPFRNRTSATAAVLESGK